MSGSNSGESDPIDRMIAMIEAEASRGSAGGFSAANKVLANQGLVLDALFAQLVRDAVADNLAADRMLLALRAQSQSRATLTYLMHRHSRDHSRRKPKNSDEQTVENRNCSG